MLGRVTWLAKYLGIPYVPLTPTFPWLGPMGTIPLQVYDPWLDRGDRVREA